jgi:ABC-type transport system involved in multi-copper enzyme maturation permease subunit
MMATLTIARLTVLEHSRRKLLVALVILTLIVIAFTGWGFYKLATTPDRSGQTLSPIELKVIVSQLLIGITFMFSFVLALSGSVVASPAISADIESGLILSMLSRPIRRSEFLLGKWLGLVSLVVAYAAASAIIELLVVNWLTGYQPPEPVQLILYVSGEGIVLVTLAIALSTRLSGMTAGVIALVTFLMAWVAGIVGGIGTAIQNDTVTQLGTISRLILPTDGLWRGAVYSMEPAVFIAAFRAAGRAAAGNPFYADSPPSPAYLAWCAAWVLAVLAVALRSFRSREL